MEKSWWDLFSLWEFILHPERYGVPRIDNWIRAWGNWINIFVQTNPWFCTFLSGTGLSWFTWLVMKTPWNWDDKWPEWVRVHIFKQKPAEAKRVVHELTDVVEEDKK